MTSMAASRPPNREPATFPLMSVFNRNTSDRISPLPQEQREERRALGYALGIHILLFAFMLVGFISTPTTPMPVQIELWTDGDSPNAQAEEPVEPEPQVEPEPVEPQPTVEPEPAVEPEPEPVPEPAPEPEPVPEPEPLPEPEPEPVVEPEPVAFRNRKRPNVRLEKKPLARPRKKRSVKPKKKRNAGPKKRLSVKRSKKRNVKPKKRPNA